MRATERFLTLTQETAPEAGEIQSIDDLLKLRFVQVQVKLPSFKRLSLRGGAMYWNVITNQPRWVLIAEHETAVAIGWIDGDCAELGLPKGRI